MRPRNERGSATIETVVLAPGLLMLIGLLILGGRIALAGGSVEHAAAEAARSASIARTAAEAQADAHDTAYTSLNQQGIQCVSLDVSVDTSQFATPPGQPASVSATVTCNVNLADITIPGLPGSRTMTATVRSPLDTYRERG